MNFKFFSIYVHYNWISYYTFHIIEEKEVITMRTQEDFSLWIAPHYEHSFRVLEDFTFPIRNRFLFIKKNFISDLASIPRVFWIFYPPFGTYTLASIIHDYLYSKEGSCQVRSRKEADEIFLDVMEKTKVPKFTRSLFYYAVRLFGNSHFYKE